MSKLETIKRSDLFHELFDDELRLLAEKSYYETYEPGAIIHRQNQTLDKLYIIEEGLVGIFLELGPLTHRQIQSARKYETFGWSALVPPCKSTATVKAIQQTRVLAFNGQDIMDLCPTNPEVGCVVYRGIARVVANRLGATFKQLMGITTEDELADSS